MKCLCLFKVAMAACARLLVVLFRYISVLQMRRGADKLDDRMRHPCRLTERWMAWSSLQACVRDIVSKKVDVEEGVFDIDRRHCGHSFFPERVPFDLFLSLFCDRTLDFSAG